MSKIFGLGDSPECQYGGQMIKILLVLVVYARSCRTLQLVKLDYEYGGLYNTEKQTGSNIITIRKD